MLKQCCIIDLSKNTRNINMSILNTNLEQLAKQFAIIISDEFCNLRDVASDNARNQYLQNYLEYERYKINVSYCDYVKIKTLQKVLNRICLPIKQHFLSQTIFDEIFTNQFECYIFNIAFFANHSLSDYVLLKLNVEYFEMLCE